MFRSNWIITVFVIGAATVSRAALEFSGYLMSKDEIRFVVTDLESGKSSAWLATGETFQGHKVTGFDRHNEILSLEHAGVAVRLPLKESKVKDGKSEGREKPELQLAVLPDGQWWMYGEQVTIDMLDVLLRRFAERGIAIAIGIRGPPSPNLHVQDAVKKISAAVRASGAKKFSIKVIDTPQSIPTLPNRGRK